MTLWRDWRLETEVAELKKREALDKKKSIKDFKSFDDFQEPIETSASAHFDEDFNFCKKQLAYYHFDLGIDLNSVEMDRYLIEREVAEAEEERNKEKGNKQEKGEENTSPLSL